MENLLNGILILKVKRLGNHNTMVPKLLEIEDLEKFEHY